MKARYLCPTLASAPVSHSATRPRFPGDSGLGASEGQDDVRHHSSLRTESRVLGLSTKKRWKDGHKQHVDYRVAAAVGGDQLVPDEVARFGGQVVATLQSTLHQPLIGAYFVGSIALGGYVAGESDIDIIAVSKGRVLDEEKPRIASAILDAAMTCPTRGLEFTLYRRDVAMREPRGADFEVNANGGPRMDQTVHLDADSEPAFWYVFDRAIAHRCGIRVTGPPPAAVFPDVSRRTLLKQMIESMRWHREHEKATLYSVLNACRAWRFAEEGVLGNKIEGAAWARTRWPHPALIDAAVELRHGRPATLDAEKVDELLAHVETLLSSALRR